MEKIKELFIPKELAILAVYKGFKEPVIGFFDMETDLLYPSIQEVGTLIEAFGELKEKYKGYSIDDHIFIDYEGYCFDKNIIVDEYPAITYDQMIKWFREKHKIMIEVKFYDDSDDFTPEYKLEIYEPKTWRESCVFVKLDFKTYHEALIRGIKEAFELI